MVPNEPSATILFKIIQFFFNVSLKKTYPVGAGPALLELFLEGLAAEHPPEARHPLHPVHQAAGNTQEDQSQFCGAKKVLSPDKKCRNWVGSNSQCEEREASDLATRPQGLDKE